MHGQAKKHQKQEPEHEHAGALEKLQHLIAPEKLMEKEPTIVVFKNMFSVHDLAQQDLEQELREDLQCELQKIGKVASIELNMASPEGVVEVAFLSEEAAQKCIDTLSGRYYKGRAIVCELQLESSFTLGHHS